MVWGRAAYGTIDQVPEDLWEDILNTFNSKGFTITVLTKEARDFEDLDVEGTLDALNKGIMKVIDFSHEFDFKNILFQRPDKVISTLTNEILWILKYFKEKGIFTLQPPK
jgi:hypothetical protein